MTTYSEEYASSLRRSLDEEVERFMQQHLDDFDALTRCHFAIAAARRHLARGETSEAVRELEAIELPGWCEVP